MLFFITLRSKKSPLWKQAAFNDCLLYEKVVVKGCYGLKNGRLVIAAPNDCSAI